MPQELEITHFHDSFEQNVTGSTWLLNEYKSRIPNWARQFPAFFLWKLDTYYLSISIQIFWGKRWRERK